MAWLDTPLYGSSISRRHWPVSPCREMGTVHCLGTSTVPAELIVSEVHGSLSGSGKRLATDCEEGGRPENAEPPTARTGSLPSRTGKESLGDGRGRRVPERAYLASTIIPAPTVLLVASSTRMKPPVRRLRA